MEFVAKLSLRYFNRREWNDTVSQELSVAVLHAFGSSRFLD